MSRFDLQWLISNAFFGCKNDYCVQEVTYPADMLALLHGEPICQECYEQGDERDGDLLWADLPKFDPFQNLLEYRDLEGIA